MDAEEAITGWNENARRYANAAGKHGDYNKENVLNPALFELLGDVSGKRALDAGCGEGYLSRLLEERGAEVVAVDFSQAMVDIAKSRTPSDSTITFLHGNIESLRGMEDASFDLVVSSMVLQDVPDHGAALRELRRVLRNDGDLLLAISHPCFSSDGSWYRSESGERLFWRTDNYFYETARPQQPMPGVQGTVNYFHRALTTYFRSFKDAGLVVDDLVEPRPSEDVIHRIPGFKNDLRMSHFIVFRLSKRGVANHCVERTPRTSPLTQDITGPRGRQC